jgi:hypothetical protein
VKKKVIVFGIAFWYPLAGVTFQFLHYLLGLRRLGYDPYYIEDSGRWVYSPALNDLTPEAEPNIAAVGPVLDAYGFKDKWAFRGQYPGGRCFGLGEEKVRRLYREAEAFLNVTGSQELRDEHLDCPLKIYVETDPVASQISVVQRHPETLDALEAHDILFSFGENFGAADCRVPVERFEWHPTRQPVVLDLWADRPPVPSRGFTTIGTWKNKGKDVVFNGEVFHWSKDLEFEKFFDLPKRTHAELELACNVDEETLQRLKTNGWRQVDSVAVSRDIDAYRSYIQGSRGEFTVAKDQNIRLRSGWFSDRSACYLAAGRPVINQDTGFGNILPTGRGLFDFSTMEDILNAIDTIQSDYDGNCRAASEIANDYFAAEKVIGSLMRRAGL